MHQIRKGTLKFDGFKPFAAFAFDNDIPLLDPKTSEQFVKRLVDDIKAATDSKTFVFGHRAEAMFAAMVTSIGAVQLLKFEDGSNCFAQDSTLEIPDFRAVLDNGQQLLIEAKNHHSINSPEKAYRIKATYMEGLKAYAALMQCDLRIAIYWSRWNLWSLNSPDSFSRDGEHFYIELGESMKRSDLSMLGDMQIGTTMPLKLVVKVEQFGDSTKEGTSQVFKARATGTEIFCAGKTVNRKEEQRIAMYLMFYGSFVLNESPVYQDGRITAVEYVFDKEEKVDGQKFEIVGSLSSMFSRFYRHATSDEQNGVTQIHARYQPGALGKLIPDDYKGTALPLIRLIQQHSGDGPKGVKKIPPVAELPGGR